MRSRFKELSLFGIRILVFSFILIVVLNYAAYVITPKADYGICSIVNYYKQEEDTVDLLVLGTSMAYAGVNTNVLWEDYGIAAYNLCSAEQPFWVSYYYLQEALKTQQPKLILLDAKPAMYQQEFSKDARTILSTSGIREPSVRFEAIRACVGDEKAMEFALMFPKLHQKYADVTPQDFVFPPDNGGRGETWKGYIEKTETEKHEKPSLVWVKTKRPMQERQEQYVRKIFELVNEKQVPMLVVGFPNPDYAQDHMYYNSLWAVAEEYGIPSINYNDPELRTGLRYSSDFADWQHLNVKGSVKFSHRLAQDLHEQYHLPNRKGNPKWQSWQECSDIWFEQHPEYVEKGEAL